MVRAFLGLVSIVLLASAQRDGTHARKTLEIQGGWWLTSHGFSRDKFYVVNGTLTRRRPAQVDSMLRLDDLYVVAPYADAHTHTLTDPGLIAREVAQSLASGIFYVMSLTGSASGRRAVADHVNRSASVDAQYAESITSTRGHPLLSAEVTANRIPWDSLGAYWPTLLRSNKAEGDVYFIVDNARDLNSKWSRVLANKPDLIKIYLLDSERFSELSADTTTLGRHGLDPTIVPAIVERAHRSGLRVAAHVETAADFRVAAAAGVDIMAHLPGLAPQASEAPARYVITPSDAALAKRKRVTVVATAWLAERLATARPWLSADAAGLDTAQLERAQRIQRESLRNLARAGVPVAVGSDLFSDALTEALYLRRLGVFDSRTVLLSLTQVTPRLVFPKRRIGALAPGYEASFVALACNPIERLECVREIRLRVKQGTVLTEP